MSEDVFGIVGTTQGPYRVESVVAEGGFGVVYRAFHDAFRAPVALKCLKVPGTLSDKAQAEFLERFREEAEVMFRLSASIPAVVRPLHADVLVTKTGQFVPFMALEWLDGETLDVVVAKRKAEGRSPLTLKRLVRMLTPVARALERAHNFPGPDGTTVCIVHCDLKPDNIFLIDVDGVSTAKILDFGIAKVRDAASRIAGKMTLGDAGNAFTPGYAAPEQWLPKRFGQTGPWTDVWGLALTLIEAALARPVIEGDHASMMGTAIDEGRRPTPRAEGLIVSDEVEAVFARALAVDPRKRYPDVGMFWDDLERAMGLESSRAGVRRDHRAEGGPAVREERIELGPRLSSHPPPTSSTIPSQVQPTMVAHAAHAAQTLGGSFVARPMNPSVWSPQTRPSTPAAAPIAPASSPIAQPPPSWTTPQRSTTPAPISPPGLSFGGEIELSDDEPGQAIALDLDPLHQQGPVSVKAPRAFDGRPIPASSPRPYAPTKPQTDLKTRLGWPLRMAIGGVVLAGAEQVYVQLYGGEPIALGPVRLVWVAAGIAVVGVMVLLGRLFWPEE